MIDKTDAINEVKRLRGLKGYPKPPADEELYRAAMDKATDVRHLHETITAIVDDESRIECPRPGQLKALLRPAFAGSDAIPGYSKCPYNRCVGDGWEVVYSLHTKMGASATRERVTHDQAQALWKSIDPAKQVIYEGVTKCLCKSSPFSEHRA